MGSPPMHCTDRPRPWPSVLTPRELLPVENQGASSSSGPLRIPCLSTSDRVPLVLLRRLGHEQLTSGHYQLFKNEEGTPVGTVALDFLQRTARGYETPRKSRTERILGIVGRSGGMKAEMAVVGPWAKDVAIIILCKTPKSVHDDLLLYDIEKFLPTKDGLLGSSFQSIPSKIPPVEKALGENSKSHPA